MMTDGVGPLQPRFPDVRRIAVLRAGGLGDLLFAVPAVQSLIAAYPDAEITLLGTRAAQELLSGRPGTPDRVVVLPAVRGVGALPDADVDAAHITRFLAERQSEGIDLAVQLHGGGRFSNPFLLAMNPRHTIGTRTSDAAELERSIDYVYYQHEVLRALEVVGLAGASPVALEPSLKVTQQEREAARAEIGGEEPVVVMHPGATDPRRRWPLERFADVARRLVRDGVRVVLVGGGGDADLSRRLADVVRDGLDPGAADLVVDTAGRLALPVLAGVLAEADVVLANDSGPRHLAHAVGSRTVSIYWFGNVVNAGPLGRGRHRIHLSWTTHCPVCGRDSTQAGWTAQRCAHDVSFVADVAVSPVYEDVIRLLDDSVRSRTPN